MASPNNRTWQAGWAATGLGIAVSAAAFLSGQGRLVGPGFILVFAGAATAFASRQTLRPYAFTLWVLAFVAASLAYPWAFGRWFGFDLAVLIVPLIQIIMFGMGTTLSLRDFRRVFTMPWPVLVGVVLQFSVMPVVGFSLAAGLGFPPEIAAGVVLIGSCPGGVASNLMAYLAGGNVALSVTMTSCSTMLSPLMTPLLMKLLAAQYIEIQFLDMMLSICNMIIVPIVAGLIANRILYGKSTVLQRVSMLVAVVGATVVAAVTAYFLPAAVVLGKLQGGVVLGLALIALVTLAKLIMEHVVHGPRRWMDRTLPIVSMAGICYIIAIITARSAGDLLNIGLLLLGAAVLHNLVGYLSGYWLARLCRLAESDCRTVAFEVGMQNGGMASGLAMNTLQSASAALAPAIFGPWMNVSGSMLASWWRGHAEDVCADTPNSEEENDDATT